MPVGPVPLAHAAASQLGDIVPTTSVVTMEEAVEAARARVPVGGIVLLAPACASFDQYSGFEERGDHFRKLVQSLPSRGAEAPRGAGSPRDAAARDGASTGER